MGVEGEYIGGNSCLDYKFSSSEDQWNYNHIVLVICTYNGTVPHTVLLYCFMYHITVVYHVGCYGNVPFTIIWYSSIYCTIVLYHVPCCGSLHTTVLYPILTKRLYNILHYVTEPCIMLWYCSMVLYHVQH